MPSPFRTHTTGNSHKESISHLAYETFISIASGQRVYTHTQLHRPKHTTSTEPRVGDKSEQEKSVASSSCSSDRCTLLPYAVLCVPKVSQYPPLGVESKLKRGISCLLLVRRFDGGELLLPVCQTLGEDGLVFCLLGLLVVDASVIKGAEVAVALEADGGDKALDFGAALGHRVVSTARAG